MVAVIVAAHGHLAEGLIASSAMIAGPQEDLVAVSARMSAMNPESIAHVGIPVHPGALRYYKEKGILK